MTIKANHKDITRVDQPSKRTHGWNVRVRFIGETHGKFFSDRKLGGKGASLLAAISWRDATEKKLGKPRTDRHIVTQTKKASGVAGVRLNEKLGRYEVSWVKTDGKQGKTSVSVKKYGKEKAFKRACDIRERKENERLIDA